MTAPKKKPVNSRAKGARGELELAKVLTDLGYPARRGQQFKGGAESPDVVCEALREKGYHLESMYFRSLLTLLLQRGRLVYPARRLWFVLQRIE